jgi:hypothetical protein
METDANPRSATTKTAYAYELFNKLYSAILNSSGDALPEPTTGGKRSAISKKFDRCVKSVGKTVKTRKGSTKESAAIAICTTTVLYPRKRTMKKYRKGRLVTQRRKLRGGEGEFSSSNPMITNKAKEIVNRIVEQINQKMKTDSAAKEFMITIDISANGAKEAIGDIISKLKQKQEAKPFLTKMGQGMATVFTSGGVTEGLVSFLRNLVVDGEEELYTEGRKPSEYIAKLQSLYA